MPVSAAEHRRFLKAIAAGDPAAAGDAARAHVLQSKERTIRNHSAPAAGGGAPAKPAHA
jgi:DNA-binding FadR family transcriptional regulator